MSVGLCDSWEVLSGLVSSSAPGRHLYVVDLSVCFWDTPSLDWSAIWSVGLRERLVKLNLTGSQVMIALGEMSAYLPHKKGFPGYATRYVDPAFGFALGWNYLMK